jgi:hypothetical protein
VKSISTIPGLPPLLACAGLLALWEGRRAHHRHQRPAAGARGAARIARNPHDKESLLNILDSIAAWRSASRSR